MTRVASSVIAQAPAFGRKVRRRGRRGRHRVFSTTVRRQAKRYLRSVSQPKLHLGCGGNVLPGWLNADRDPVEGAVYIDVTSTFPLPSASFERVFSEHTIEHIRFEDAAVLLGECQRVLRPGGRIRVGTPDLERIVGLFGKDRHAAADRYMREYAGAFALAGAGPAFIANQAFRGWGHQFLYDEETLASALTRAGFAEPQRVQWGQSEDSAFAGVEAADNDLTRHLRAFETLCMEAFKDST